MVHFITVANLGFFYGFWVVWLKVRDDWLGRKRSDLATSLPWITSQLCRVEVGLFAVT